MSERLFDVIDCHLGIPRAIPPERSIAQKLPAERTGPVHGLIPRSNPDRDRIDWQTVQPIFLKIPFASGTDQVQLFHAGKPLHLESVKHNVRTITVTDQDNVPALVAISLHHRGQLSRPAAFPPDAPSRAGQIFDLLGAMLGIEMRPGDCFPGPILRAAGNRHNPVDVDVDSFHL